MTTFRSIVIAIAVVASSRPVAMASYAPMPHVSKPVEMPVVEVRAWPPGAATPTTMHEIRGALQAALASRPKLKVNPKLVAMLLAHVQLETGGGRKMRGFNFGWIGCKDAPATRTVEWVNGKPVRTASRFCSDQTLEEGAERYVALMTSWRYRAALDAARAGDPEAFVTELYAKGYFTAPPTSYAASLVPAYNEQVRLLRSQP